MKKLLVVAIAVALSALGLSASPAQAATVLQWGPIDVAGCESSMFVTVVNPATFGMGIQAGTDTNPCDVPNAEIDLRIRLYALPIGDNTSTVQVAEGRGRCNLSQGCQRAQGFWTGILPPGLYRAVGTFTVRNYVNNTPVVTTLVGDKFTYTVTSVDKFTLL